MIDSSSIVRFLVLIMIAFVVVMAVRAFLGQSRKMSEAERLLANAPTTGGVVVDTYRKRLGGKDADDLRDGWVNHYMVVRFTTADRRTVEFHAMAAARVGQEVEVRYDPANPESTYIWKLK